VDDGEADDRRADDTEGDDNLQLINEMMYFCSMYKLLIKPFFFLFSPEKAHYLAMDLLKFSSRIPGGKLILKSIFKAKENKIIVAGIEFPNKVGLAAGFDKDARWIDELALLGFGHVEIGTLTPKAQPGNDKPRLFRLPLDNGLINRMGFNNGGVEYAAERLRKRKSNIIVGGNIGKNKITPNEDALSDYLICLNALHDCVDYFVVNVSSPNTPGLRELQEKEPLMKILSALAETNNTFPKPRPIFLKIAPDLTDDQLNDIVEIVLQTKIAGVIATNTTISREHLQTTTQTIQSIGMGGLSGAPVRSRSTEVIRYLYSKSNGAFPIIGVGGIHTSQNAQEKIDAGAALVQVYTGFIYEGPAIARNIANHIR
jgi:dihydroorotate dehydrogenase